jgi:hypothetical protein
MYRRPDMMWKDVRGVDGKVFNWIRVFSFVRSIEVRVRSSLSESYEVDNGSPQGTVISPLFSIMIDNVLS